jgi:hypothetical protein
LNLNSVEEQKSFHTDIETYVKAKEIVVETVKTFINEGALKNLVKTEVAQYHLDERKKK